MNSPKWSLNQNDFKQIAINGGIVVGGALLAFLAQTLPEVDFGKYQVFGTALIFIVGYAAKRWALQTK